MPFEPAPADRPKPAPADRPTLDATAPSGDDKKQISAVVWVFLAVGAILIGLVVVLVLFRAARKDGDSFAVLGALEVIKGVAGVVGTAANKVEAA